jgi:hypothetical protein
LPEGFRFRHFARPPHVCAPEAVRVGKTKGRALAEETRPFVGDSDNENRTASARVAHDVRLLRRHARSVADLEVRRAIRRLIIAAIAKPRRKRFTAWEHGLECARARERAGDAA